MGAYSFSLSPYSSTAIGPAKKTTIFATRPKRVNSSNSVYSSSLSAYSSGFGEKTAPADREQSGMPDKNFPNNLNTQKSNISMFQIGLMLAPLCVHFIRWVLSRAKYPVRVILRDGEMFMVAARELADAGIPEFAPCAEWTAHYATRGISAGLDWHKIFRPNWMARGFLNGEGWGDNTFTFVDTGFSGTICDAMARAGFKLQPLFFISSNSSIPGFFIAAAAAADANKPVFNLASDIGVNIFDSTPKTVLSPKYEDIVKRGGKYSLDIKPNMNPVAVQDHTDFMDGIRCYVQTMTRTDETPLDIAFKKLLASHEAIATALKPYNGRCQSL